MSRKKGFGKIVYLLGIVMLGITALFTLASGLGTVCVALNPTGFGESMALLAPFQWVYLLYVIITTAIGGVIAYAFILFIKRKPQAYSTALLALIAGLLVGIIHIFTSRALRGKSMPVDAVVYTTILTLLILLLFRIRTVKEQISLLSTDKKQDTLLKASLITLWLTGLLTFTIPVWLADSHTWNGTNWAAAFPVLINTLGLLQIILATAILLCRIWKRKHPVSGSVIFKPSKQSTEVSLQ